MQVPSRGDDDGKPESREARSTPRSRAAATALVCALLVAVLGLWAPPVVAGDLVVPPFVIHAGAVLAALFGAARAGARPDRPSLLGRLSVGGTCAAVVALHTVWSLGTTRYTILEPTGPDGCRVVARESTLLIAGDGSVGIVGRHGGPVRRQVDYSVDDGGTPVRQGSYELTWGADGTASVKISQAYDFGDGGPFLSCR